MSKRDLQADHSPAWIVQTWCAFFLSILGMLWGIWHLSIQANVKVFMSMGLLFVVSASLTVAKTSRDLHENKKMLSRIDQAKLAEFLARHDPFAEE